MLERLYKSLTLFLGNLADSLISLLKVVVQSKFSVSLPPPSQPVCSVLGNGPSLRDSLANQLDFITSTEIVCVNLFTDSPFFTQLRPQNYVLLDPALFAFSEQSPADSPFRSLLNVLLNEVTWSMYLYVPQSARTSYLVSQIEQHNKHIKPVYFNYTVVRGFAWLRHRLYASGLGMAQSQTVVVASMFLMLNRRFSDIYLFGADQSWHEQIRLNEHNELEMQQLHFYDKPKDVKFLPVYNAVQKRSFTIAAMFLSLHKVFMGYEVLQAYADYLGIKLWNASAKSYIDALARPTAEQMAAHTRQVTP